MIGGTEVRNVGTWVDCERQQSENGHLKTPMTRCATEHLIIASGAFGRSLDQRYKVSTVRIRWDLELKFRAACEAALQKLHGNVDSEVEQQIPKLSLPAV